MPLIFVLKIQKDRSTRTKVIVQKSDGRRQDHTIIRQRKFALFLFRIIKFMLQLPVTVK